MPAQLYNQDLNIKQHENKHLGFVCFDISSMLSCQIPWTCLKLDYRGRDSNKGHLQKFLFLLLSKYEMILPKIMNGFLFFRINLVPQNGGQNEAKRVSTIMSLWRLHACRSKGLASDFLCLKRREGEKRRGLLNRRGRRRRWNWLGLGLLDFDLDLVLGWWAWTRWGLSPVAVGGVPGSSLTGNNERWTKEFNTDEDFSQSVTVSH